MSARRVLIVEDNLLVAKFYKMALERAGGFTCIVTENVDEILREVDSRAIDLAILDISLSASRFQGELIDGVRLAQMLKQRLPKLPILIATAHAMTGDRERLLQASGADGYLEKPIYDAQLLVDKVRELLK
ncbi:MAG TPA: response regulator [Terriglobales bacterium]|nr:response regulator [Terriglobales bacterium]